MFAIIILLGIWGLVAETCKNSGKQYQANEVHIFGVGVFTSTPFLRACTMVFQRWCFVVMFLTRLYPGGQVGLLVAKRCCEMEFSYKEHLMQKCYTFVRYSQVETGAKKWGFWSIFRKVANYLYFSGLSIYIRTFQCSEIKFSIRKTKCFIL